MGLGVTECRRKVIPIECHLVLRGLLELGKISLWKTNPLTIKRKAGISFLCLYGIMECKKNFINM